MKKILIGLLALSVSSPCFALDVEFYTTNTDRVSAKLVLASMGQAFLFASIVNESERRGALYCPPETVSLTGDQYESILFSYLKKTRVPKQAPIEMALLDALRDAFPCK